MSSSCSSSSCGSKKTGNCGSAEAALAQQKMAINSSLGKIKNKILVMSGKGGVGKSTVSTNLALALANKGHSVGLMDVDLHGPDICRMLNLAGRLEPRREKTGLVPPVRYSDHLKVISLEYMMENRDDPVIWRGPLKVQAIRQFIADIDWGELDYLIIDAPPGTGDEPLTVATTIKDALALVVTTPQEIALADVRKSLHFCRHVKMEVLGLVENMSGLICPHCRKSIEVFKTGGGERLAADFQVRFLGKIPMDPRVVLGGDEGKPYLVSAAASPAVEAFAGVVANVEKALAPRISIPLATAAPGSGCACGDTCNPDACGC
jgi:ATP-binding protein involved in chromosome partitioning